MVIFTDWFLSPVISRMPMAGEDTGLEAVVSPMVGYLGKVQERAASMDHCPWCHAKGQTYALHSYRLNLEESITLCTNPQCLFPLVSRPLEDVLATLEPVESAAGTKRKSPLRLVTDNEPSPKRSRLKELESSKSQTSTSNDDNMYNTVDTCNGSPLDVDHVDGHCDGSETKQLELQQSDCILNKDLDSCTDNQNVFLETTEDKEDVSKILQTINNQEELPSIDAKLNGKGHSFAKRVTLDRSCSLPGWDVSPIKNNSQPVQTEAMGTTEPMLQVEKMCNMLFTQTNPEEELVSAPVEIFWRNKDNLCWLDSLLVALVHLRSRRNLKPKDEPEESPVSTLLAGFDEAYVTIQSQQQTDKGGFFKVPKHLLHKINTDLETLRMSVFSLLQPKLQCKLGHNESPVFALPLLVKLDSWLESLFQSIFYWDFRCTKCKSNTKENVVKTLPTFTNIVPDWHPLRAVHLAPCNNCHRTNQRRRMVLQRVPPVFALHFVEGLPDNNIQVYNFNFKKKHYSITSIIQYSSQLKHFVTWIHKSDGLWVEFDDLKHPHCKSYKTLPVPAREIHVVFWEEEQRQESRACSPSTTFTESPPSTKHIDHSATDLDILTNELLQCSPDQSLNPQNISHIMDCNSEQDTTVTADVDTTIGSTTLIDAFEGLTHNDIVTLTLVEIKEDSKKPLSNLTDDETEQVKDLKSQNVDSDMEDSIKDGTAPAPDSSSTIDTINKSQENELSSASEPEDFMSEEDNMAADPTFEPQSSKKRQKRARTVAIKQVKKPKVDTPKGNITISILTTPARCKSTPTATSKPMSPVSSTVPTLLTVPQAPLLMQPEQKGWSHLLERSLGHIQNISKINLNRKPATQLKQVSPIPSTPQQRRAMAVKVTCKPVLKTEDSGGLPLKAAEMYGAFGSKNAKSNSATVNVNKMPLEPPVQKAIIGNTVVNNSLNTSSAGLANYISSCKKTKSSKMPSGLSETEALRYKLFKKLKAKKKKLAKLNELLGQSGDSFKPDSTNNFSPNTVTSSTLDDEFFSDLLSPATTITSNLSPDSTDFLEMLANGQEATVGAKISSNTLVQPSTGPVEEDFLDEFMSQAVVERPNEMEEDPLSALDLFL